MKSKLTKIILLITLAILPTAFAQAQTTKKTTKKKVKTKRTTKNVKPLVPDKITVAPNTLKSRSEVAFTIGAAKPEPASNTFKTETINKFDIASIDVPSNMTAEVKEETKKNGEVEWTTYRHVWKTPLAKTSSDPSLSAEISTNIYMDFTKVVPEIPADKVTPELLLQMEHFANVNSVEQFPDKIKDVKMLNLNGTDGTYVFFKTFNGGFVAVWQTYRLIEGKMQMLTLTIEGDPGEISKAEQIIKSFKLSAR